jgi:2-C-methyl-D-erythritol 2,4-cyclodiphosphate synthase
VSTVRKGAKTSPQGSIQRNRKIARPSVQRQPPAELPFRVGFGNDLHRLVEGRKLILGGVQIPFSKGPFGHSDGDVLSHAICDALLGAAALGDIGTHFPDSAPGWRHASSLRFLQSVRKQLDRAGFHIVNLDATVGLEKPKLAPYIERIRRRVAKALGIHARQVSVKAKTGEGMGEIGSGEAVQAEAIALVIANRA